MINKTHKVYPGCILLVLHNSPCGNPGKNMRLISWCSILGVLCGLAVASLQVESAEADETSMLQTDDLEHKPAVSPNGIKLRVGAAVVKQETTLQPPKVKISFKVASNSRHAPAMSAPSKFIKLNMSPNRAPYRPNPPIFKPRISFKRFHEANAAREQPNGHSNPMNIKLRY